MSRLSRPAALLVSTVVALLCGVQIADAQPYRDPAPPIPQAGATSGTNGGSGNRVELQPVDFPNLEGLEPAVAEQLQAVQGMLVETLEGLQTNPSALEPQQLALRFGELGMAYQAYEFYDAAEAAYLNAVRLAPDDFRWVYYLATLSRQQNQLERANTAYRRALEIYDQHIPARYYLAQNLLTQGDQETAVLLLQQILQIFPVEPSAHAALAEIALQQGEYQQAIEHLTRALDEQPEANRLHYTLGMAYRGLGDMDKARHHLELAGRVGVRPQDRLLNELTELAQGERVYLLRGRTAFAAGRYNEAAQAFANAIAADPQSDRARTNLAAALGQLGRTDEAVLQLRKVIENDPYNRTVLFNLAMLLVQKGEHEEAAKHLEVVVEGMYDDPEAQFQYSLALRRLGRHDEALVPAQRAVGLDPLRAESQLQLTQVYLDLDQTAEAARALRAANELMPEDGRIARALARLLAAGPDLDLRDGARALELAELVFQAQQTTEHAELIALALAQLDRCEEAATWQRQAIEAAAQAGAAGAAQRMTQMLIRYDHDRPCRP